MIPTAPALTASRNLDSHIDFLSKGINLTNNPTRKNEGKNIPNEAQSAPEIPLS